MDLSASATSAADDYVSVDSPHTPDLDSLVLSITSDAAAADDDADVAVDDVADGYDDVVEEREELPEEMRRNVVELRCDSEAEGGVCRVYLIGTAHVSQSSLPPSANSPLPPPMEPVAADNVSTVSSVPPPQQELGLDLETVEQRITLEADEMREGDYGNHMQDEDDVADEEGYDDEWYDDDVAGDEGFDDDAEDDEGYDDDVEDDEGYNDDVADDDVTDEEREELPEEMRRSVVELMCDSEAEGGVCRVYVIGTGHISQESCDEVQAVISFLKPEVVFLELCSSRVSLLKPQDLKVPTMKEMVDMWKKQHNLFGILYSWFLAKVASSLDVFPGAEFRVAYEEALKCQSKVILGDRPVQITLRRTWAKMPRWHKIKLISSLFCQTVFLPSPEDMNRMLKEFDDVDMLTLVIKEMSKKYPTLMETVVHERDLYMSSTLWRVARSHSSVVAVVGKGHLQGIKKNWMKPVELESILEVDKLSPKKSVSVVKILTTIGVVGVGAAIISGIYISSKK